MKDSTKIFKVDKKIVFKSTLPWVITMSVVLLFLMHNFRVGETIRNKGFWIFIILMWIGKFILDIWTINYEKTVFDGSNLINYFNSKKIVNALDFASVKQKKTIYTNYLGFEYKEPKGIFVRFLFPYNLYNPRDLQSIMAEILKINPAIKLEDDFSRSIAEGTYKTKLLG